MSSVQKKKVVIMAASGSYNLGDELILREEVRFTKSHYGNVDITVMTYDMKSLLERDPEVHYAHYFPTNIIRNPIGNIWYLIRNTWLIAKADVLVVGGGGIIFDNEVGVSFRILIFQWHMRIWLARVSGTTLLFWWVSLEVEKIQNKMQLKSIFTQGDFILVRDDRSHGLLEALEIDSVIIDDMAFLAEAPPRLSERTGARKRVGISVRWGFLGEREALIPLIYDLLAREGYDPVFLIHTTSGGYEQNDQIMIKSVMKWRTYNTSGTITQTLAIYPTLYAVIGMRFHAGVLACIHEIPFLAISYAPKTDELVKSLGIEHMTIPANELTVEKFENMWHTLISGYDREQKNLAERHYMIRETLKKTLETL
jgi:polysaccharide pyruvyl transferase WcaK-like protein